MGVFFSGLRKAEKWTLVLLMIVLIVVCFLQVWFRLVMKEPLAWTEELARYAFVWLTFIGGAAVVGNWGHFQVDFLLTYLPPWAVKVLRYFGYACILVFAYIMAVHGWELLAKVFRQKSAAMLISMSYPYAALPLSGVLMVLHLVELILKDFGLVGDERREVKA